MNSDEQALALDELRKILNSPSFYRSRRHSDLLSYLVRLTLAGHERKISEYSIAWEVYGKAQTFNPEIDAAMRVEVRRLRARLENYYATEGAACSPIQISLRSGYIPRFNRRESAEPFAGNRITVAESESDAAAISECAPIRGPRRFRFRTTVALAAVAIASGVFFLMKRASHRRTR